MISIKTISGNEINLLPNSSAEIERTSPFFSEGLEWTGEYSTPIQIPYSEHNTELLGYPFSFYTKRIKKATDAELFDGSLFRQRGKLITENGTINQNHIHDSNLTGYFVFGLSNFFQIIKDKKLRQLSLGGKRSFNYTTSDPNDNSGGFWQYIHGTWAGDKDFLVAPIRNENVAGARTDSSPDGSPDWMNKIAFNGVIDHDNTIENNTLFPQIKLKYVLTKIFEEHGYTVQYDIGDEQWESLFLISLIPFDWRKYDVREVPLPPPDPGSYYPPGEITRFLLFSPKTVIDVYLANHLPDKTISDFLIQLGSFYGWRFLVNDNTKVCRIKSFKRIKTGKRKDWTSYVESVIEPDYSEDIQVIGFATEVDAADEFPKQGEFDGLIKLPSVYSFTDLPTASAAIWKNVCFSHVENTWWQVVYESSVYSWAAFSDNIFNYEPKDETKKVSSTFSTTVMVRSTYRNVENAVTLYYGLFPAIKQEALKDFSYRVLFYHGMVLDELEDGTPGLVQYPHLSSLWRIPGTPEDKIWSNVFVHDFNDIKRGIINYWFSEILELMQQGEEIKFYFNLPRNELLGFEWDDIILIKNIPFLAVSITEPVPYKNKILAVLRRIG